MSKILILWHTKRDILIWVSSDLQYRRLLYSNTPRSSIYFSLVGGLFVNVIRHANTMKGNTLDMLKPYSTELEDNGLWKCLLEEVPQHKKYIMDCDAMVMVYTICGK